MTDSQDNGEEPQSTMLCSFGAQVRALREASGMSRSELGKLIDYSESMVGAVERGTRIPKQRLIPQLDELLGARGALNAAAEYVEKEKYPKLFRGAVKLEAEAVGLFSYETMVIPGLLQTEAYARAVIAGSCPPVDDEEIERQVAARMERQALLTRKPLPLLGFVIDQAAILRTIGGWEVHRTQLHQLLDVSQLRHITIQVMPLDCEVHPGSDGPMVLLDTPEGRRLAYIEGQGTGQVVSKPEEVSALDRRYGIIRAQALTTRESRRLIEEVAGQR